MMFNAIVLRNAFLVLVPWLCTERTKKSDSAPYKDIITAVCLPLFCFVAEPRKKGEKFRLRTPKKKATRRERGESEAVGSKSREKAAVPLLLIILSQYINIKASPALVPPSRE